MLQLSKYMMESLTREPIRPTAINDWRKTYKGGKNWESYLKAHPKTITNICSALVGREVDNWFGRKDVFSEFINMFFCGYLGGDKEPLAKVKSFTFDRSDGRRSCTCIAYDKWNGGELAQFTFELVMDSESELRAYKAGKFNKIGHRKLKITCQVAKYKKDGTFQWVNNKLAIVKMSVPPINDTNRQSFHNEVIKQMLDAAHYMNWGSIDPINNNEEVDA